MLIWTIAVVPGLELVHIVQPEASPWVRGSWMCFGEVNLRRRDKRGKTFWNASAIASPNFSWRLTSFLNVQDVALETISLSCFKSQPSVPLTPSSSALTTAARARANARYPGSSAEANLQIPSCSVQIVSAFSLGSPIKLARRRIVYSAVSRLPTYL